MSWKSIYKDRRFGISLYHWSEWFDNLVGAGDKWSTWFDNLVDGVGGGTVFQIQKACAVVSVVFS